MKIKYLFLFLLFPLILKSAEYGKASYYSEELRGITMANNEPFDPDINSAASWNYPLGSLVKVTNISNSKSVIVEITDRGPDKNLHRIIDLSKHAFEQISPLYKGLVTVKIEKIKL